MNLSTIISKFKFVGACLLEKYFGDNYLEVV